VIIGAALFFMRRQILEQQMQLIQHILLCMVASASEVVASIGCGFIVIVLVIFISIIVRWAIRVPAEGFVV